MPKFKDISIGIYVVLVIVCLMELYYAYNAPKTATYSIPPEHKKNYDKFKTYLALHAEEVKKRPASFQAMLKSIKTGFLRGMLLGLVTFSFEGALAGGLLYAVANPIILGIEHVL